MELHSYAKLRGYKKWTIEQKRKLVEARINYDGVFTRKSSNCVDSWKKIIAAAKLNDFNVYFVRKQWANMLTRYKAYKRTRLRQLGRNNGDIEDQVARQISEEWEFFYPIHSFMSKKPTNFHSYAQKPRATDGSSNSNSHDEEEDDPPPEQAKCPAKAEVVLPPNTDHDFYSKSAHCEVLDIGMEEEEAPQQVALAPTAAIKQEKLLDSANSIINHQKVDDKVQNQNIALASKTKKKKKKRKLTERDKYYKHKRRYDRRNERRFDALLNVFGQVVKEHYPNLDTSRLAAQGDQISTEDDDSMMSSCSADSVSSRAAASTPTDESGL